MFANQNGRNNIYINNIDAIYYKIIMSIKSMLLDENIDKEINIYGWVRTLRSSSSTFGFCNVNDGSNVSGIQIIINEEFIELNKVDFFFKNVHTGTYLNCYGKLINSPAEGQKYELVLSDYKIVGFINPLEYPLV